MLLPKNFEVPTFTSPDIYEDRACLILVDEEALRRVKVAPERAGTGAAFKKLAEGADAPRVGVPSTSCMTCAAPRFRRTLFIRAGSTLFAAASSDEVLPVLPPSCSLWNSPTSMAIPTNIISAGYKFLDLNTHTWSFLLGLEVLTSCHIIRAMAAHEFFMFQQSDLADKSA